MARAVLLSCSYFQKGDQLRAKKIVLNKKQTIKSYEPIFCAV